MGLKVGATIYIEVEVTGLPAPKVAWYHGDKLLDDDARITIETNEGYSVLKVKGAVVADAGKYSVTAENQAGKDSASFEVNVKCKFRYFGLFSIYAVGGWVGGIPDSLVTFVKLTAP